ncbi:RICIN domain-containing protein [Streptosporangium sp. NPDC003464]
MRNHTARHRLPRVTATAVATAAVSALTFLAPGVALADARPAEAANGDLTIRNELLAGKCLDADLDSLASPGTKVQLWWDCNGQPQQKWFMPGDGTIRSRVDAGKCLDADLNTLEDPGTRVQLWWDCNGQPQQKWDLPGDGTIHSRIRPHKCLDADLNTREKPATVVQLWACNGEPQQKWALAG